MERYLKKFEKENEVVVVGPDKVRYRFTYYPDDFCFSIYAKYPGDPTWYERELFIWGSDPGNVQLVEAAIAAIFAGREVHAITCGHRIASGDRLKRPHKYAIG